MPDSHTPHVVTQFIWDGTDRFIVSTENNPRHAVLPYSDHLEFFQFCDRIASGDAISGSVSFWVEQPGVNRDYRFSASYDANLNAMMFGLSDGEGRDTYVVTDFVARLAAADNGYTYDAWCKLQDEHYAAAMAEYARGA